MPMFYSMFRSVLEDTGAKLLATMNTSLYEKIILDNEHMVEDFTIVEVNEPSEQDTLKILENNAVRLGEYHNLNIPSESIKHIYKKARTTLLEGKFPQKGIELMDHACSYLILKKSRIPQSYKKLVDKSFTLLTDLDDNVDKGNYDIALKRRSDLRGIEEKLVNKEEHLFSDEQLKLTIAD
jgi:ATP-dependent Clp protease ATP-binding subunit ClpA